MSEKGCAPGASVTPKITPCEARLLVDARNTLGEGAIWDGREQSLFWVDIEGCRLYCCDATGDGLRMWSFAERVCSFALREAGGFVVAFSSGIAFFDPDSGAIDWVARPEEFIEKNRFNEGKCDRAGRFWAGTMDDELREHTGSLYRLDAGGSLHRVAGRIAIPNSIAWSPDNRIMYFADTLDHMIFAYDFDAATGAISNRRVFASTVGEPAGPDGSTVDAEGYLWNAQWGAARLARYAPDGRIDRIVPLPVLYPTSCSFGGPDLATLYVTSAVWDLTPEQRADQPWSGGVLALSPGVCGLPESRFAG